MIAIVVYGIIAIALASVAGYSIISFFDASRTMSRASENLSRMDMAISVLKSNVRYINGQALVPDGALGAGGYTILPSWIGAYDTAVSGDKYIYCPFASIPFSGSGTTANIVDGDTASNYTVDTVDNYSNPAKKYVSGFNDFYLDASVQNKGILSFLLSPLEGNSTIPLCKDVQYTASGNFVVTNGIVKVLQLGTVAAQRNILASSKAVFYVDDNADVATTVLAGKDGSGRDISNPSTIDDAFSFFAAYAPRIMEIRINAGAYSLNVNAFSSEINSLGESKLLLIGDGGNQDTITLATAGATPLQFPVNLHLKDVGITSDLDIPAGRNLLIDGTVKVKAIALKGANLYLGDGDTTLEITGAHATGGNGITLYYGSKLVSITNLGDENIIHFSGSPNSGIYNKGQVDLMYTNITFVNSPTYGIFLAGGSTLNMDDVDLAMSGVLPDIGVYDNGDALGISGTSTDVRAGVACWDGGGTDNLFEYSMSGPGSDPQQPAVSPAAWGDANVEPYIEYQILQSVNNSTWTCN